MNNGRVDFDSDDLELKGKLEEFLPFLNNKYRERVRKEDARLDADFERAVKDLDKINPSHSAILRREFTREDTEDKVETLIERLKIKPELDRLEAAGKRIKLLDENIIRTNDEIEIERESGYGRSSEIKVQQLEETRSRMELQALVKKEMALKELLSSKLFKHPVSVMCPSNVEKVGQSCIRKLITEKEKCLRELQRSPECLRNSENIHYDDPWSYKL